MSITFKENITKLDFSFIENEKKADSGVLLTKNYEKLDKETATPEIIFALETAKKFDADAVYFRYFNDGRGAIPQIYIYDNTSNQITQRQKNIHIKIWSGCQVPMYIIIGKSAAQIFDAREKTEKDKENEAIETIEFVGGAIKKFSALDFDDGLFWEEEDNKGRFRYEKSVYRDLITGLKKIYNDFQNNSGLDRHIALKLFVQCLLIKYLEEREEESHSGYFAKKYFQKKFGCENFCGVIRSGKLLDLFDQLSSDFNGKIFEWDEKSKSEIKRKLKYIEAEQLAEYLDAKIQNDNYVLWRLYSFSYLPVELISSVYEELLTNSDIASKDIVYTPEMIVSTLIDECMPLKQPNENFRVIDVSCGSGIFLVKAYKRMIQWWRYEKWKETKQLEKPSLKELKNLLIRNIYGIDINEDAISLTVFSLALAMLDEVDLNPPLWEKLKFPDLSENNIKGENFFKYITQNPPNDFDLVIGNPPFNLQSGNGKEPSRKVYFNDIEKEFGYKNEIKIPDENPALHFLTKAMKLLKPDAMLCLIQPSGPLLYQKDIDFKQAVFSKYNLLQVIDFTKLANVLWGKKNIATAAVFLQNSEPDRNDVVHIIANRTFANVNKLFLELDHYDFHNLSKDSIINNPFALKANLIGGGRIVSLLARLSTSRKLSDYIKQKIKHGWIKGEGFIENKNGLTVDYITNKKFLPTEALSKDGIDHKKIRDCEVGKFQRRTNEKIFLSPHLLIRKILGTSSIILELVKKDVVFKSDILGIHAPKKDERELLKLRDFIKRNGLLLRFYILSTSSRVKVLKETSLYDEDILNIPYPENLSELKLSKTDKLLIEDSLQQTFSFDSDKRLVLFAKKEELGKFAQLFCSTLNSVYEEDSKSFQLCKIIDAGKYYVTHFIYSDKNCEPTVENKKSLEESIEYLTPTEKKKWKSYHIHRVLKIYGKDSIILAKPKQLRYWRSSIALRDADEAFADYIKARYY